MTRPPRDADTFLREDWFAPAILSNGGVDACLKDVENLQKQRASFIRMIRDRLVDSHNPNSDSLTVLGQRIKTLEQAVRTRIGVLSPERPQSWFRAPSVQQGGPFSGKVESLAVIGYYPIESVKKIKSEIIRAWTRKNLEGISFALDPKSMWSELLSVNSAIQDLITLPEPYLESNLLMFAHTLPRELSSESLAAFMGNVAHEIRVLLSRLDKIYLELLAVTEKLWAYQEKELLKNGDDGRIWTKEDAKSMRDDFKKRRNENKPRASAKAINRKDLDSLMSMGFDEVPDQQSLRHRYIELAKRYHPDLGGDESEFKELTQAYSYLSNRIEVLKN